MMATYRLPDGVEVTSLDINGSPSADKAWVTHPMLGSILIDRDKLTEIPSEPEDGFVGRFGADIWQRDDKPETNGDTKPGEHWWHTGNANPFTWHELCVFLRDSGEELIPLVPDRGDSVVALEKVGLPWAFTDADEHRVDTVGVDGAAMARRHRWAAYKGIEAA